ADAWDKYTPAQVAEILSRCRMNFNMLSRLGSYPYYTGTYVFQTREGGRGVLQIIAGTDKPQTLTLQYKLIKPER
ncbi:MAG TPA: hypothetical protein VHM90_21110, partial [Phycisphaerae bacterium]|nr:hypothetical protein [Phycisphaerae bacterium]